MDNYTHLKVNHSAKEFVNGMASVNGVESFWALLKRGYHGIRITIFLQSILTDMSTSLFLDKMKGNCKTDTVDRIKSLCMLIKGKYLSDKSLIKPSID